jgi:NADPH-dependent ferric siderophore reductase
MNFQSDTGFRYMTVIGTERIGCHMQRLRLSGDDLGRFDTFENLHIRLYVPEIMGERPLHSLLDLDGRPRYPTSGQGYAVRYYTIRRIDAEEGWMDIDFVLHDAVGPACTFARQACIGDMCGISGPCGLSVRPADTYLLAGDETALPAIARILEGCSPEQRGCVLIKANHPDAFYDLTIPERFDVRWFYEEKSDCKKYKASIIAEVEKIIAHESGYFIWFSGEYSIYMDTARILKKIEKKNYINVP